jgi:EAL domain-containing protein (putative c-di-GMP-specific phosphodiesterase class I)
LIIPLPGPPQGEGLGRGKAIFFAILKISTCEAAKMATVYDLKELKKELLTAIKQNEFVLHYQPQFNLRTTQFDSVEALIRWQHPKRGLLGPDDFIPFAEQDVELIIPISHWVLSAVCQQIRTWQDKGLPTIRIAINVTEKIIKQSNFPELVLQTLQHNHLSASCLEIELTENIIFQDEIIFSNIHQLKKMGLTIALDDFGYVYPSFNILNKIPIDKIKIAKVHIDNIHANPDDAAMVKEILQTAADLNLQVVVEGVETLKQLEHFFIHNSVEFQGFYFSEPLSAEAVEKMLVTFHK